MEHESKHTGGPWRAKWNGTYGPFIETLKFTDPDYGTAHHDIGINRHCIATVHGPNARANAALIARAPEMQTEIDRLRAVNADLIYTLQEIAFATALPKDCSIPAIHKKANAALEKARS